MNKWATIAILTLVFITCSLFAITNFTTLPEAKWTDDGADMVYGVVLIVLIGFLLKAYELSKNKNILFVSIGFIIMAFTRVLEITLQEYQISINYNPLPWGAWIVSYCITFVGILFVVKGLLGVNKK